MEDLIKFGAALVAGYFIADFLSPKGWSAPSHKGWWPGELHKPVPGDTLHTSIGSQHQYPSRTMEMGPNAPVWHGPGPAGERFTTAYQGYVFGQGHGQQRHQWDFMPHSLPRRAYQGVLGVDYTLACSDQSTANGAGICANGTHAVISPISQPPTPVQTPVPAPVTPLVPTSSDSGLPVSATTPAVTTPAATPTTPTVTTVPVTTTPSTPTPVVTSTPTPLGPAPVDIIPHPHPIDNDPNHWRQWSQQFRSDLREDLQEQLRRRGEGRGDRWGRNSAWAFHRAGRHAYAGEMLPAHSQDPQGAVLLVTNTPNGLHLDAHGLQSLEPVTVDLNIPLSNISKTTNLMSDATGHLSHDYNMTRPPGKTYIAAIRVTGQSSKRVGFKSVKI